MKNKALLFLIFILISSCTGLVEPNISNFGNNTTEFVPVLMNRTEMEEITGFEKEPRTIITPGKIYHYEGYIYLNERYKGLHIIDNRDRRNPRRVGFLNIPGNLDMSVKNDRLFTDNTTDLLTFDISNPELPHLLSRGRNAFPELAPPDLERVPEAFLLNGRPENTVIVAWEPLNQ